MDDTREVMLLIPLQWIKGDLNHSILDLSNLQEIHMVNPLVTKFPSPLSILSFVLQKFRWSWYSPYAILDSNESSNSEIFDIKLEIKISFREEEEERKEERWRRAWENPFHEADLNSSSDLKVLPIKLQLNNKMLTGEAFFVLFLFSISESPLINPFEFDSRSREKKKKKKIINQDIQRIRDSTEQLRSLLLMQQGTQNQLASMEAAKGKNQYPEAGSAAPQGGYSGKYPSSSGQAHGQPQPHVPLQSHSSVHGTDYSQGNDYGKVGDYGAPSRDYHADRFEGQSQQPVVFSFLTTFLWFLFFFYSPCSSSF